MNTILLIAFTIALIILANKQLNYEDPFADPKCEAFFSAEELQGICGITKKLQYSNTSLPGWCMLTILVDKTTERRIIDFVEPVLEENTTYEAIKQHTLTYHSKFDFKFEEDNDIGSRSYVITGPEIDNQIGVEPFSGKQPFVVSSSSDTCTVSDLKDIANMLLPRFIEDTEITEDEADSMGIIEGSMSYPSSGIPDDIVVCAENITSKKQFCTNTQIKDKKYKYGIGYKIDAPAAGYYVFALPPRMRQGSKDYRAYYSEYVTCGIRKECTSHTPIVVTVEVGKISHADPMDWYNR